MIAMTLAGRLVTVAASGFDAAMAQPMIVEAVIVVLLALGHRGFARTEVAAG
jgi:hypothetical protein